MSPLGWLLLMTVTQTSAMSRPEMRAPVERGDACEGLRELEREIQFPPGRAESVITIHAQPGCVDGRLVIWKRAGEGFVPRERFDGGRAGVEYFRFGDRQFLHLRQSQPAAGRDWVGHLVMLVTDEGELRFVEFDGKNDCDAPTPPIGTRFEHSYGGSYTFRDDDLRFEWNIWKRDDSPNFPTGGAVSGTLSIVEAPDTESGLRIVVKSCRRVEGQ